ncbi:hypothetical protein F4820DRAFT_443412 [Hypoxylon rubiginosum]|uniref:Uncharacterized protein n=1 Tax=Hypoxylon rubiginosum TaxID=110542 RepID=A0ACB9ZF69_9PEZI|nr:hypothetical protein F4820DRAFT_443412 [Hypoxylon rubiginosum]
MRGLNKSTLFHRKSKSNLSGRNNSLDDPATLHARKWSTSSTVSQASSTTSSHDRLYDPLSLHPPLSLNTSPHIIPEYEEDAYREDEERESRFFNQRLHHAGEHIRDAAAYSPVQGHNCYFARPAAGGKPYVYDQGVQWPLKDWQAIPPGLATLGSSAASSPASSPTRPADHRRRPTDWMNDGDALLKRGDWKRRGIVFHLGNDEEELQERHFELPEL